jgi:signal recognition particle subunit SRP54
MFDELSSKLTATLRSLTGRGVLTEDAVKEGLREIRRILLEADVSFDLTRDFLERVQAKAIGRTRWPTCDRGTSWSRSSTTSWS